ncbi:MAG: hypothetical protein JSS83_19875 [Cyanobacteria bacterium SZAS LIN-3]|nr:hypothetical protein [Cyanobacteria bacterium SZAS LIN-3]MBS2005582.1 hypothetical protein [Cyanobacteria bacterium SZAS TMP-1]
MAVDESELRRAAVEVGLKSEDPSAGFDLLAQDPHRSVALLVAELHPIARRTYFEGKKPTGERHVVGCLRALRYITGRTFVAATGSALSADEKQFLDFDQDMHDSNPSHKLHFFGVWMSRNADFVAPTDVQKAIIKSWRRFQETDGRTFNYKPRSSAANCIDDWFWYG